MPERYTLKTVDYRGRVFDRFYPARSPSDGPGWYVYGRNPEYGDNLVMLCARPDVKHRRHPHYNVQIRRGFHTRREAQQVADQLNRK
jgi:hypothetical protein